MSGATEALIHTAARGELHHALILHGPASELLRSTAIELAAALNCRSGQSPDCDCTPCSKVRREIHPDVHMVSAAEGKKLISVGQVREMITQASLKPYEGRTKVFIVDPADGMSTQAANSLLKTLEEPSGDTVFLLLTSSSDRMLPTIRSRAHSVPIRPFMQPPGKVLGDAGEISLQEARLRAPATSDDDADRRLALGREAVSLLARTAEGESDAAIALGRLLGSLEDPAWGAGIVAQILRDLAACDPAETISPPAAERITEAIPAEVLLSTARSLLDRSEWLRVNPDPQLLFESCLLELVLKRATRRE
jgi:DNA polymerase III delta prime subunit